jgi:tetratricopeptide (TPR) repeat protein
MARDLLAIVIENAESLHASASDAAGKRAAKLRLARAHYNLAILDGDKSPAQALSHSNRAAELFRELVAAEPKSASYQSWLGGSLHNRGLLQERLGKLDKVEPDLRAALQHSRTALQIRPRSIDASANQKRHLMVLARLRATAGDWKEAVAFNEEWLNLVQAKDTQERLRIASNLAAAAAGLDKQPSPQNSELKRRALELARTAANGALAQGLNGKGQWWSELAGIKHLVDPKVWAKAMGTADSKPTTKK